MIAEPDAESAGEMIRMLIGALEAECVLLDPDRLEARLDRHEEVPAPHRGACVRRAPLQIRRIDGELNPDLPKRFSIKELPTIVVVDEDRIMTRSEQPRGCAEIQTALARWLR